MTLVQDRPTVATNIATIKQWVTEMAKGDFDKAPYAEDAEISDPSGKYKGKAQILQSFKVWKTAFPQGTGEVTNQIAMGDHVTSAVTFKSTHTGPLVAPSGTIAPTNKPIELNVVLVSSFRNGLIQRERTYYDQADLMRQLGIALPPKP
jgi:predicted ester cyclase